MLKSIDRIVLRTILSNIISGNHLLYIKSIVYRMYTCFDYNTTLHIEILHDRILIARRDLKKNKTIVRFEGNNMIITITI